MGGHAHFRVQPCRTGELIGVDVQIGSSKAARLLGAETANGDALDITRRRRFAGEVDAPELEAAHLAVAPRAHERGHSRLVGQRPGVNEHARAPVGERLEPPGSPLGLDHDRGAEPEPVKGWSDDAERKDLGKRQVRLDAQETAELTARGLDDREVQVAIDRGSRPAASRRR